MIYLEFFLKLLLYHNEFLSGEYFLISLDDWKILLNYKKMGRNYNLSKILVQMKVRFSAFFFLNKVGQQGTAWPPVNLGRPGNPRLGKTDLATGEIGLALPLSWVASSGRRGVMGRRRRPPLGRGLDLAADLTALKLAIFGQGQPNQTAPSPLAANRSTIRYIYIFIFKLE